MVELVEAQAVFGDGIEVSGVDFAAVCGEVREAHVIDLDEDDVGLLPGRSGGGEAEDGKKGNGLHRKEMRMG